MIKKKVLSLALALAMIAGSTAFSLPAVYAAEDSQDGYAAESEIAEDFQETETILEETEAAEPVETETEAETEIVTETEAETEIETEMVIPETAAETETEKVIELEAPVETVAVERENSGTGSDPDEDPSETGEDIYYQIRDWSALPGNDRTFNREYFMTTADGRDEMYEITDIVPVSDGWNNIVEFRKDYRDNNQESDDWWWYVRAKSGGTVKFEVQAKRLDGTPWSYSFNVNVSDDVYYVGVDSETGQDFHLPGDTAVLQAFAEHHSTDPERDGDISKLSYNWDIVDGNECVEMLTTPFDGDPAKAQLTFKDLPEGTEEVGVYVRVILRDENGEDVAEPGRWFMRVRNDYKEIYPTRINGLLPVGGRQQITAELRSYPAETDSGYENVRGARFRWYYDPEVVEVLDAVGGKVGGRIGEYTESDHAQASEDTGSCDFTIHRLNERDTNIHLDVIWTDGNGEEKIQGRDYRLERLDYRIWIDDQGDNRLYDGGTLNYRLITEGLEGLTAGEDYRIELNIGERDDNGWNKLFTNGQEYTFNPDTGIITLDGSKIFASGVKHVDFYAGIRIRTGDGDEDWLLVSENMDGEVELRESFVDLDREWDRDMLRGWDGRVNGRRNVYVENADYPDGRDFEYTVTNVEVIRDVPWEGQDGPVIIDFHPDQKENDPEDRWWYYRVGNYGEATLRVTYQLPEELGGQTESYDFNLYVGSDVYNVMIVTEDGVMRALPGGTIELFALTWRDSEYDNSTDGITFEWELKDDGAEFAELISVPNEPWHKKLKFRDLNENEDRIWQDVRVRVTIFDGKDEETGDPVERASEELNLIMASDYRQIMPTLAGLDMNMGDEVSETWEVRHYPEDTDTGYTLIDNVHFYWSYDPNCVQITDSNGQVVGNNDDDGNYIDSAASVGTQCAFTIKRLREWGTGIHLEAVWTENGREERESFDYFLTDKDYNIWFEPDRTNVYDDSQKTITLNTEQIEGLNCSIEYEIGWQEHDEETDTFDWVEIFDEDSGIYSIDGNNITIFGDKVAEKRLGGVNVHAKLIYNGEQFRDTWCWVELNESCGHHFWATGIWKPAKCEETGTLVKVCPNCFEVLWEEIPAKGHSLQKVAAKAATLTATGNIAYYKCDDCGKLFSDAAGTVEISQKDTVIPKLIAQNITAKAKAATIAVGKTTQITVTGNKGKVTYTSTNTKIATVSSTGVVTAKTVGTGSVNITVKVAATGRYAAATKTVTIKITKGAQPMTAAPVSKSVLYSKVSSAAQVVTGAITVKNAQGTVTYVKASGSAALTINKTTGKVTVKKGTKKGTYKMVVKVTAAGNSNYKSGYKNVTVTVVVK